VGNVQPVGKKTSTTPRPERPRNPRPIFDETFGQTTGTLVQHHQPPSLTVTPLPSNPPIVLMTPEEIGAVESTGQESDTVAPLSCEQIDALLPDRPNRREIAFGPLDYGPSADGKFLEFEFTLEGLLEDDLLTLNVWGLFRRELKNQAFVFSDPKVRSGGNGAVIAFKGAVTSKKTDIEPMCKEMLKHVFHVFDLTHNVFMNLQDLGIVHTEQGVYIDPYAMSYLRHPSWRCSSSTDNPWGRFRSMQSLLSRGYYEAGVRVLSDLLSVCDQPFLASNTLHFYVNLGAPASEQTGDSAQLDHFVRLLCLDERILSSWEFKCQVGRIVLRELVTRENNASALKLHHVILFERFAEFQKSSPDFATALLRELLDLPTADRVSLFRSPKARKLLLIAFPKELWAVFEKIEERAYEVFCDRREKLEKAGVKFSGKPLNYNSIDIIDDSPIGDWTVDTMLDLAEAAVMCAGRIQWAVGVLQFLPERILSDDQVARAVALRDRIQIVVRFDPLPEVAATFDTIKKLTDIAIAKI
jgi:hypothetical protein